MLINSITFSQAPWLKKIYSELLEVHKHLHGLTESFIKRGYKENFLIDQFNKISEITREALLTSKPKAANKPRIPLPLKFNRTLTNTLRKSLTLALIINLKNTFQESNKSIQEQEESQWNNRKQRDFKQ